MGVGCRALREGGDITVDSDGRGLLIPEAGRDMESSSSWIADDILDGEKRKRPVFAKRMMRLLGGRYLGGVVTSSH